MLRILSFAAATAALLIIPFTQADARRAGMSGVRMSSGHIGMRSIGVRSAPLHVGSRRVILGSHLRHRRFVGFYSVGLYSSCWRWVPSVYGLRRVWVCDYPYSYYY